MLCALWATLSTVASILACSGFYLPYWIQVREDFPSFSFLTEATGGSRIDDRSIDRCPKIDRLATIDRLANGGTLAFFLLPLKFTRADRNRIRIRVLIRRRRRRLECIVESAILIATRDRSAHISFPSSFAHRAHSLH